MCEAWARRKKVEQDTNKTASIDQVNQPGSDPWWSSNWDPWNYDWEDQDSWSGSDEYSINAVGKGKGKGKGKPKGIEGNCWVCDQPGHRAADCPKGKGKRPKGKGK